MDQESSFPVYNVDLWSGSRRIDERQRTVRISRNLELNFAATVRNSGIFRIQMGKAHGVSFGLWGDPVINAIVSIVKGYNRGFLEPACSGSLRVTERV